MNSTMPLQHLTAQRGAVRAVRAVCNTPTTLQLKGMGGGWGWA